MPCYDRVVIPIRQGVSMSPDPGTVNDARETLKELRPNATAEERALQAADAGTDYAGVAGSVGPTGAAGATGAAGPTGPA